MLVRRRVEIRIDSSFASLATGLGFFLLVIDHCEHLA